MLGLTSENEIVKAGLQMRILDERAWWLRRSAGAGKNRVSDQEIGSWL